MATMAETKLTPTPVKSLHFDRLNPRLAEYGITTETTDDDILVILWEAMDVMELVQSIASSGFFPHEALVVSREHGRNIVIEGNRRLAAVKVLLDDQIAKGKGWEVPTISDTARKKLETLPVIFSNRQESWRYLGFKHVNGPAKWSSYAKAHYIAEVHRTYEISLIDIANQIGDRHRTVQRLYRGLMVIDQAEREKVYDREDRFRQRFAFSHLYTGLDYDGVSAFISLKGEDEERKNYVPKEKVKELGELCVWLYGSKKENRPPVVESQNPDLRRLNAVLSSREAIAALRAGAELAKAFEISRPPTAVFEESLLGAKRELTTARAHLTTGYDKSEALLRIAGSIANMADDIYTEMERKQSPEKKKRAYLRCEMFKLPHAPSPQAEVHELADFTELQCWTNGSASRREIIADLGRVDDNDNNNGCDDDDDENSDSLDEVMLEIERRESACGNGYPFRLDLEGTVLRFDTDNTGHRSIIYRYLLLSTRLNMKNDRVHSGIDGSLLLEEISAQVLKNYLGTARARSFIFGTSSTGKFSDKVTALCRELREGTEFRTLDSAPVQANDDKVDVVAWIPFSDFLPGQLIIFGQCKTGSTWSDQVTQLQPDAFIRRWMRDPILVNPVRAFCVSEAADRSRWNGTCLGAGVLLDRCRLVDFCDNLSPDLLDRVSRWTSAAKEKVR